MYFAIPLLYVKHDKEWEVSLNNILKEDSINSIDIGNLISYDWEKAYMFTPYTEEADMKDVLGLKFHDPAGMALRDDIELLVVVTDDSSFEYAEVQLGYGYLMMEEEYLTPENDVVKITQP